jgi:hypothetical protein
MCMLLSNFTSEEPYTTKHVSPIFYECVYRHLQVMTYERIVSVGRSQSLSPCPFVLARQSKGYSIWHLGLFVNIALAIFLAFTSWDCEYSILLGIANDSILFGIAKTNLLWYYNHTAMRWGVNNQPVNWISPCWIKPLSGALDGYAPAFTLRSRITIQQTIAISSTQINSNHSSIYLCVTYGIRPATSGNTCLHSCQTFSTALS